MGGIFLTITKDGMTKLAIRIGGQGSQPNGQALSRLLRSPGYLISQGRIEEWRIESLSEEGGETLFYGPAFEGKCLDELCGSSDTAVALAALSTTAAALALAAERKALPTGLQSCGILVGAGDAVLLLPPEPAQRAFRAQGTAGRASAAAFLRSPRAEGPEAEAAFLLAQAAYRATSGESAYPISGEGQELAKGGFLPLAQLCPRLEPALAAAIDSALAAPEAASLGRLREALAKAMAKNWERELSAEEERALERRLGASKAQLEARRRREAFWRKRGGLVIGAGAAFAIVLVVVLSLVDARRGKPSYETLSPRELVQTYYRAVDAMDLDSIEACADREASKPDLDYVSTMTVISKMRQAYEGKNPVVQAAAWLGAGKPELPVDGALFGLTGLTLAEASTEGDEARFSAEYSSWSFERSADEGRKTASVPTIPVEHRLRDELQLEKRGKKGWRIVKLERAEL